MADYGKRLKEPERCPNCGRRSLSRWVQAVGHHPRECCAPALVAQAIEELEERAAIVQDDDQYLRGQALLEAANVLRNFTDSKGGE